MKNAGRAFTNGFFGTFGAGAAFFLSAYIVGRIMEKQFAKAVTESTAKAEEAFAEWKKGFRGGEPES